MATTVLLFKPAELWCSSAKLLMGTQIHSFPHPAVLRLLFFLLGPRNVSLWSESGSKRGCKELFRVQHGAIPSGCRSKVSDNNIMNFRSHLWVSGSRYTVLACPEVNTGISQLFMASRKWKLIIHLHPFSEKRTLNCCWHWGTERSSPADYNSTPFSPIVQQGSRSENLQEATASGSWDWCPSRCDYRQNWYEHRGDRRKTLASGIISSQRMSEVSFAYTGADLPAQFLNMYFSQGNTGDQKLSPVACTLHTSCFNTFYSCWTHSGDHGLTLQMSQEVSPQ